MGVLHRRQAGTEVDELIDALADHVPDTPTQDSPVVERNVGPTGSQLHELVRDDPIDSEVVLTTQKGVVNPCHARHRGIDTGRHLPLQSQSVVGGFGSVIHRVLQVHRRVGEAQRTQLARCHPSDLRRSPQSVRRAATRPRCQWLFASRYWAWQVGVADGPAPVPWKPNSVYPPAGTLPLYPTLVKLTVAAAALGGGVPGAGDGGAGRQGQSGRPAVQRRRAGGHPYGRDEAAVPLIHRDRRDAAGPGGGVVGGVCRRRGRRGGRCRRPGVMVMR